MALRALLDSTYILPAFGIAVKGLSREDLEALERLRAEGKVRFYFAPIIWVEVIPKVFREYSSRNMNIDLSLLERVALALESTAEPIEPGSIAVSIAAKLRALGHRDMIDNLLYGIAVEKDMLLLTMDKHFKEFLSKHELDASRLVDHKQLHNYTSNH